MGNIAEYLSQIQTLTQKNLEILQALNDSFFTKREHITVSVNGAEYVIPSFIALENKINSLQENFNNLVYAPKTGEATFQFDGNSRSIEVKGYTCTPNRLLLDVNDIPGFSVEQNDIFKDFLTPNPYVKFDLQSLPNDITKVVVRKVALKSDVLKSLAKTQLNPSTDEVAEKNIMMNYEWSDLWKILSQYKEDVDYVMYDTIRSLPVRANIGSGEYVIKSIDKDITDEALDEYITLTLDRDLKYTLFDETIEKYLTIGDCLVTYDDSAKMEITAVNPAAKQLTVRVLNGDYLNLVPDAGDETNVSTYSKLKFFSPVDYDKDKYLNVTLEEDQYVFIFIAALNDRLNVQAPWGRGVLLDAYSLPMVDDAKHRTFKNYYDEYVRNVGDILYEVSSVMTNTIMKYSKDEFDRFSSYKPYVDPDHLQVVQINTHLNNSTTVKNIRTLYSQKQEYIKELGEVQTKITEINQTLSELSFTDTTGVRDTYTSQLSQYNTRKNELTTSLTKIIQEISAAANDSVVPLENAKYHIRGYFKWNDDNDVVLNEFKKHIHGIKVQYRYKTVDSETGTARTIDKDFVFSDWNDMPSFKLQKNPVYKDGYQFEYPQHNGTQDNGPVNEPSFNQIDIPISQGETVDIRLKIVWDFGYPFIESTSDWSDITNIAFPDELLKDVQVLQIVEENNNDIETNRFENILREDGVLPHVEDKIVDQDVTYFHKPENISSGFYTSERRIIPLRDKLQSLDAAIQNLDAMINGTNNNNLTVSVIIDGVETVIKPGQKNTIDLPAYSETEEASDSKPHVMTATLQIANTSVFTSYLYSMFPGNRDITINDMLIGRCKFDKNDYITSDKGGVWMAYPDGSDLGWQLQKANQWLTFRINNAYNGEKYYIEGVSSSGGSGSGSGSSSDTVYTTTQLGALASNVIWGDSGKDGGMIIYPLLSEATALQMDGDDVYSKVTLAPGEAMVVPLNIEYLMTAGKSNKKTISFDVRPSLYNDPSNYMIQFNAFNADTAQQKSARSHKKRLLTRTMLVDSAKNSASTPQSQQLMEAAARYKVVIKNQ